jgi:sugar lactone lactonase YvrE
LNAPQGVTLDAQDNVFLSDTGNHQILELTGNNTNPVGSGFSTPQGLAIDGAGDLFVADSGLGEVIEVAPQGRGQTVVYTGVSPTGVAIDGAGDLFIVDGGYQGAGNGGAVLELPANGGSQTTIYESEDTQPVGVAVDAVGDVFVTDTTYQQVVEVPLGCDAKVGSSSSGG